MNVLKLLAPGFVIFAGIGNPGTTTFTLEEGTMQVGSLPSVDLGNTPASYFVGTVDADGNVNLPMSGMHLNPVEVSQAGFTFTVTLVPVTDATGHIDSATKQVDVNGKFKVTIQGAVVSSSCAIPDLDLHLSSASTNGVGYDEATGLATIVDSNFVVPKAQSCGLFTGTVNSQMGLPSAAGHNSLSLTIVANPLLVPTK